MSSDPLLPISILLLLLIFYALCIACETALDSISESSLRRLEEREDDRRAALLTRIADEPESFQSGVHLAALAAETVWFVYGCWVLGPCFPLPVAGALAVSAAILALLLWFLGRTLPRRIALNNPERAALFLCPPFHWLALALTPVTALFLLLAKGILRILRLNPDAGGDDVSEDEIMAMVDIGQESGAIEAQEKELIENVFEFNNNTAEDVMVHRTDMEMISLEDDREHIVALIEETGLSRFPVYREDADDIVGILNARDYLLNLTKEQPCPLEKLLRPAYFVPESVRADTLFRDMQSRSLQIAIVVDEYGGTSGLVTLEDLLEEIVGNIYDELDPHAEQEIFPLGENRWRVAGSVELETLADTLGIDLPEEELYTTLGGLVISRLPVIPEDGARPEVVTCGLRIQVEELTDRRVEWAVVSVEAPEAASETA